MSSGDVDVLIVGAGPTGLTLACALAQRSISFRIIEKMPAPPSGSRGKGLQPRSLEVFDDLDMVSEIVADGKFDLPVRLYDEEGHFKEEALHPAARNRPDAPYLSPLLIPQFRVEEKLRGKLNELGAMVSFGTSLSAFQQDEDGVTATLQGPDAGFKIRCRYLVGCDGGKSTIREIAGISFAGETIESYRMLLGDVHVQGLDRDHWHIWRSKTGFFALCPLPSTDLYQLQSSMGPNEDAEVSLAAMQRHARERATGLDIHVLDASWMSLWRANVRMVDRYRSGNVFLAGDAAHVHSPAGGQGMNTGIQDGYNLAWKLAAVLGGAGENLLDSYQEERLPIAAWVLGLSTEMMNAAAKMRAIQFRRDEQTLQLGLNYRHSRLSIDTRPDGEGLRAGDRAPQAPRLENANGRCGMFDLLRGPHWTLIGMGACWRDLIKDVVTAFPGSVEGHTIGDGSDYFDSDGHARAAYGESSLYVIRPDNYVGLATDDCDLGRVKDYLRAACAKA